MDKVIILFGLATIFLIGLLLLDAGGDEIIIEKEIVNITTNITRYINNTINNTITLPCNDTKICYECEPCAVGQYKTSYVQGLIQQLKRYEKQQDKYYNYNNSECDDNLNNTTVELDLCKDEMCEWWNTTWC